MNGKMFKYQFYGILAVLLVINANVAMAHNNFGSLLSIILSGVAAGFAVATYNKPSDNSKE